MRDWTRRQFLKRTAGGLGVLVMPAWLVRHGRALAAPAAGGAAGVAASLDATYFALQFGMDEALIRRAMQVALSRGGDYADLYFQHRIGSSIALEDGQVNRASSSIALGVGVRVLVGHQTGYAYTEELSEKSIVLAAETAASIANGAPGRAPDTYAIAGHPVYYPIETAWAEVGIDRKIPFLEAVNARVIAADPRVQKVTVRYRDATNRLLVVNSDGHAVEDEQPSTYLGTTVVAEQDGRRERNSYAIAGRRDIEVYTDEALEQVARTAVDRTMELFDAVQPPAGEMPVVLGPGDSGILLHEAIGHGMEADFNRKKISIYADMIGRKIASEHVTIVDDGTNPHMRGTINVDDEGATSERTVLVENGILRGYMHDRISARHYDVAPTGSGRRQSFRHRPIPRMRNTFMENGPHDPEEIIRSVQKGIYAVNFSNGQVQIGAGDFSFYVSSGYLIEDGKLTAPVKDINMIGNGPKALENVSLIGNDFAFSRAGWGCGKGGQFIPVSLGQPTIKIDRSVTIGGVDNG